MENEIYEKLMKIVSESSNYRKWRRQHGAVFGGLYQDAFPKNKEARICLTAALTQISQRNFEKALPMLEVLEQICETEADEITVCYFKGLNYELLGRVPEMEACYERLRGFSQVPPFLLAFHPYYRTAKFAQRDSECSKSMYYYEKALEFYYGKPLDERGSSNASHIIYDIATLCLYRHDYEECDRFLKLSYQYDPSLNAQREYVKAVLCAIRGEKEECDRILSKMSPFLKEPCEAMVSAILSGRDPHYFAVAQDRSRYEEFWESFSAEARSLESLAEDGAMEEVCDLISQKLTKAMPFMQRSLACRMEPKGDRITVLCKNYRVRSLTAEHSALFARKPEGLSRWEFLSVEEFEDFSQNIRKNEREKEQ